MLRSPSSRYSSETGGQFVLRWKTNGTGQGRGGGGAKSQTLKMLRNGIVP